MIHFFNLMIVYKLLRILHFVIALTLIFISSSINSDNLRVIAIIDGEIANRTLKHLFKLSKW